MEKIPAPTIDDITGHTVMVKMRNLIKNYVATIAQVIDRVEDTVTKEEIIPYLEEFLADYYTKEQIDEIIENIDLTNYYNKTQTDALLNAKANVADVYTKSQTDALVSPKADANNVYTKSQTDALLSPKADASNVYTKSQTDTLLSSKADTSNVYTKTETDNLLSSKQNELTAGTGITIVNDVISATAGSGNVEMIPLTPFSGHSSVCHFGINEDIHNGDLIIVSGIYQSEKQNTVPYQVGFTMAQYIDLNRANIYNTITNTNAVTNFLRCTINFSMGTNPDDITATLQANVYDLQNSTSIPTYITYAAGVIIRSV